MVDFFHLLSLCYLLKQIMIDTIYMVGLYFNFIMIEGLFVVETVFLSF